MRPSSIPATAPGAITSRLHTVESPPAGATATDLRRVARIRLMGTTASIVMAVGALGAGALPVLQNPALGERGIGLWLRVQHASMTLVMIGMVVVTLSWLLLAPEVTGRDWRGRHTHSIDRRTLDRLVAGWAIPLALAPPMFSKDVYSYLAQGKIAARLDDPYSAGPLSALGSADPLTINVPDIWRDTPNQYGPVFLGVQRLIYELTGDDVVAGIAVHRVVEVVGVLLMAWAVPRLAERCGVSDVAALWLGVANPLVLFHLISGIHSEALMIGLLAAGTELAARGIVARPTRAQWASVAAGLVLITCSALVKPPSVVALGFVGIALARARGGGPRRVPVAAAGVTATAVVTVAVAMLVTGSGWGWVTKLGAATSLRSWLSPPTAVGVLVGGVCQFLGLGDHTPQILAISQGAGLLLAAVWTLRMLHSTYTGALHPIGALGAALAGIVLCFPVVQPWYVLWALVPLAAWANRPAFRIPVVAVSVLLSVFTLPTGAGLPPFVTVQSWVATVLALAVLLVVLFRVPGLLGARGPRRPTIEP